MKTLVLGTIGALAIAGTAKADTTINFNDLSGTVSSSYGSSGQVTAAWTTDGNGGSLSLYSSGFGDLNNDGGLVAYADGTNRTATLTLTAQSGYKVLLKSFDLAQFTGKTGGVSVTITVDGTPTTSTPSVPNSGHYSPPGSPNLTYNGSVISLSVTETGGSDTDLGLDNIIYGQQAVAVPEPAALSLLGLGVLGLIRRRQAI